MNNKMNEEKITQHFKNFIEIYPEDMDCKVSSNNVLSLMCWSYQEGRKDCSREILELYENTLEE